MRSLEENKPKIFSIIGEYQRYLKRNLEFIRELEREGADTSSLWKDMQEIEERIRHLQAEVKLNSL